MRFRADRGRLGVRGWAGWWVILLALTTAAGHGQAQTTQAGKTPERRNVLFIAIDDLNDWVGCLNGHPQALTPKMDALARRGTLFANAHCQAPLCNPSRTSVLSGLRPSTTGVYGLLPGPRAVDRLRDRVMLPQAFAAAGYSTFTSGKIYHDGAIAREARAREFQEWGSDGPMSYPARKLVETPDPIRAMDWGVHPERDEEQGDWKIADSVIDRLRNLPPGRPFFVAAGFRLPHVPCFASQKWFDRLPPDDVKLPTVFDDDRDDVPEFAWFLHWKLPEPRLSWLRKAGEWKPLVRAYLASTTFMDSQVGRVLDALKASGHEQDTIVVLWSDHGWHLGEKGITGKNSLWERSTRVPLIVAGPGVSRGRRCASPVELLDLYPTLMEQCGIAGPTDLEGHSLVPQLRDAAAPRRWPALTTANQGNTAVRNERWRFIRYANGSEELYDHRSDPSERVNLAGRQSLEAVRAGLARWLPANEAPPVPGSKYRVLTREGGQWMWEGAPILPAEKVP